MRKHLPHTGDVKLNVIIYVSSTVPGIRQYSKQKDERERTETTKSDTIRLFFPHSHTLRVKQ